MPLGKAIETATKNLAERTVRVQLESALRARLAQRQEEKRREEKEAKLKA